MNHSQITIYTDGSCNTQTRIGGWAAIILAGNDKIILREPVKETTHNRMELTAVIKAIEFASAKYPGAKLDIYTDSQYVTNLPERKEKLTSNQFITKKGNVLNNSDLLQPLFSYMERYPVMFYKVKAHQKQNGSENLNREVDMICRQIMRDGF